MTTVLRNRFKWLTPHTENVKNLSHERNGYFRPAILDNKNITVTVHTFNPVDSEGNYILDHLGKRKEAFSIEFKISVQDKKICSRTIWDPQEGTVRLLYKDITANENNKISLEDKDTIDAQVFPVISGNGHLQIDTEQEEFLKTCYELHSKVLKQVFPKYDISYEI